MVCSWVGRSAGVFGVAGSVPGGCVGGYVGGCAAAFAGDACRVDPGMGFLGPGS